MNGRGLGLRQPLSTAKASSVGEYLGRCVPSVASTTGDLVQALMSTSSVIRSIGTIGPGGWSLDAALGLDNLTGRTGLPISAVPGGDGALLLLAVFWRPPSGASDSS